MGLLFDILGGWRHDPPDQPIDAAIPLDFVAQILLCLGYYDQAGYDTNGLRCCRFHRLTGIRGEAEQGFSAVDQMEFQTLRRYLTIGFSLNDASVLVLLALPVSITDTNMISPQQENRCFLSIFTLETLPPALTALDQGYFSNNLNPGGYADPMALSPMLSFCFHLLYLIERISFMHDYFFHPLTNRV